MQKNIQCQSASLWTNLIAFIRSCVLKITLYRKELIAKLQPLPCGDIRRTAVSQQDLRRLIKFTPGVRPEAHQHYVGHFIIDGIPVDVKVIQVSGEKFPRVGAGPRLSIII